MEGSTKALIGGNLAIFIFAGLTFFGLWAMAYFGKTGRYAEA